MLGAGPKDDEIGDANAIWRDLHALIGAGHDVPEAFVDHEPAAEEKLHSCMIPVTFVLRGTGASPKFSVDVLAVRPVAGFEILGERELDRSCHAESVLLALHSEGLRGYGKLKSAGPAKVGEAKQATT